MSLLKATTKFITRSFNDLALNNEIKKAKSKAYADVGKDISKAKKNGYYVNGSQCYKKHLDKRITSAKAKHNNRDKFISDL